MLEVGKGGLPPLFPRVPKDKRSGGKPPFPTSRCGGLLFSRNPTKLDAV